MDMDWGVPSCMKAFEIQFHVEGGTPSIHLLGELRLPSDCFYNIPYVCVGNTVVMCLAERNVALVWNITSKTYASWRISEGSYLQHVSRFNG